MIRVANMFIKDGKENEWDVRVQAMQAIVKLASAENLRSDRFETLLNKHVVQPLIKQVHSHPILKLPLFLLICFVVSWLTCEAKSSKRHARRLASSLSSWETDAATSLSRRLSPDFTVIS
jgi:hypothetical protein